VKLPASTIKVIVDLLPEDVAINDWLIYLLRNLFEGMVLSLKSVRVRLEQCNFRVEVGLEEK